MKEAAGMQCCDTIGVVTPDCRQAAGDVLYMCEYRMQQHASGSRRGSDTINAYNTCAAAAAAAAVAAAGSGGVYG
jgi:hypothetical protein